MNTIYAHSQLVEGMRVKLVHIGDHMHDHWLFREGEIYTVGKRFDGIVGPADADGDIPAENWGQWTWMPING